MLQTLEVISVNIWQILISLINLLILFLILKKFLFRPVQKILAERRAALDKVYADAAAERKAAEEYRGKYESILSGADAEAEKILSDAKENAGRLSNKIIEQANAEASSMIKRADARIEQDRKKAVNDMKKEISSVSIDIARKMISREINEKDQQELIDEFIGDITK